MAARSRVGHALGTVELGQPTVLTAAGEGVLVLTAEAATASRIAFFVRHTSGFLTVALTGDDCDRLQLPPMPATSWVRSGVDQCVAVDAAHGVSTGISASDRARTITLLADPSTGPADLRRPGHVVPIRARENGIATPADAAVALSRLAGRRPAAVLAHVINACGDTATGGEITAFATDHGLAMMSVDEIREEFGPRSSE
ncbi:3,4-dihydroxy-2-butanone-4-phosphate synthase [Amycolatopsis sp. NPDC051758]|uniref:3,4-dihydroxy-2-butanone-4-phosphate synthase n=1 Tax=Amycolatopsis sp. NPDC051758 TaxID=3363935 RepID=UPI00378F321D